jgi:hypothetical protein
MPVTRKNTLSVYNSLSYKANRLYERKDFNGALKYIIAASSWMYSFNQIFADSALDAILHNIARQKLPSGKIDKPLDNRVVFMDYFGWDNRGLTQQYLRGLMAKGKDILFILHNPYPDSDSEIIKELKEYANATVKIYTTTSTNYIDVAMRIEEDILSFSPKHILLHLSPFDVTSLMAIANIKGAWIYNVNLTDHAYWLGSTLIDYNIEFRGYGEMISLQKRGLKQSQLIRLPYYPIVSKYTKFQGFPPLPDDSVKIFCGGNQYKMFGKNDIFFRMMDGVLDQSEKAHILVAGMTEDSVFGEKVSLMRNRERVHIIGDRKDINEVYVHSDIFLSTYPLIGGLMTQYAAYNKLPILAYNEEHNSSNVESLVNHFATPLRSRYTLEDFFSYAKRLIDSSEYRKKEGEKCYNAMMSYDKFNDLLMDALNSHQTGLTWNLDKPNYESMISQNLDIENNYTPGAVRRLVSNVRFESIVLLPSCLPTIVADMMHRLKSRIWKC